MLKYSVQVFVIMILTSCNNVANHKILNSIKLENPNNSSEIITIINEGKNDQVIDVVFYTYDNLSNELLIGIDNDNFTIRSTLFESSSQRYTKIKITPAQVKTFVRFNNDKVNFEALPNELFLNMILND